MQGDLWTSCIQAPLHCVVLVGVLRNPQKPFHHTPIHPRPFPADCPPCPSMRSMGCDPPPQLPLLCVHQPCSWLTVGGGPVCLHSARLLHIFQPLGSPLFPSVATRMPSAWRSCRSGRTGDRVPALGCEPSAERKSEESSWRRGGEPVLRRSSAALRRPSALPSRAQLWVFFSCTAVDEQNAQTQEQEGFALGLSESEEKKDLKSDDRVCPTESCGVAKGRSLRKGTGQSW